jgi:hypothetical protein
MDQPQDASGMATLPGESHVVMPEPGGYYDHNAGYIPVTVNDNPCSTSDVDMAKVQVRYICPGWSISTYRRKGCIQFSPYMIL